MTVTAENDGKDAARADTARAATYSPSSAEAENKTQVKGQVEARTSKVTSTPHVGWVAVEAKSPDAASVTIHLGGDIDNALREELATAAETAIEQGGRIIINVAEVTYIGETGLSFLATLLRRRGATAGTIGLVSVTNAHGPTRYLLERTGLSTVLAEFRTPTGPPS
ncbi:anti-anti-sigma factor [Kineococcus radiotolerans]|uniref:Anti-anti-sigma factor n=1 Tax=Kineococcus radiotolerans TaxID=131568 RepID=A0A7W4TQG6_KINRA|nr:STAS domain-containing protein [Kineococcus radiotolerans]MBB2903187.1 anti-anti-sigma factor [Kineococcus radiotolerans]